MADCAVQFFVWWYGMKLNYFEAAMLVFSAACGSQSNPITSNTAMRHFRPVMANSIPASSLEYCGAFFRGCLTRWISFMGQARGRPCDRDLAWGGNALETRCAERDETRGYAPRGKPRRKKKEMEMRNGDVNKYESRNREESRAAPRIDTSADAP